MMLRKTDKAIRLKPLKRPLEKGLAISREEAVDYFEYLKPFLIRGRNRKRKRF